jgi:hypothetical protein
MSDPYDPNAPTPTPAPEPVEPEQSDTTRTEGGEERESA